MDLKQKFSFKKRVFIYFPLKNVYKYVSKDFSDIREKGTKHILFTITSYHFFFIKTNKKKLKLLLKFGKLYYLQQIDFIIHLTMIDIFY